MTGGHGNRFGRIADGVDEVAKAEREQIQRAIHRIIRKLMHRPVRALRQTEPEESDVIRRALGGDEP